MEAWRQARAQAADGRTDADTDSGYQSPMQYLNGWFTAQQHEKLVA
jgi:hypothetical protein